MATITPVMPPSTATVTREVTGQVRLTHPSRGYAMTRNPFAIWSILPAITLSFAGLAVAVAFISDSLQAYTALGAFLVLTLGLLLVPAVTLKGSLDLTHDGITFARGRDHFTAGWHQVEGVVYRRDAGLCLMMRNPQSTKVTWKLPGGFNVSNGMAQVPLRFFGDRQFSILYDIRDRLPDSSWRPALEKADSRPTWQIHLVYAGTVAICGLAVYAVSLTVVR